MNLLQIVERFFGRWEISHEELRRSFHDTMLPDCVWENVGITTTIGPNEGLAFMDDFTAQIPFRTIRVEWVSSAVAENRVYAERVDILIDGNGMKLKRVPVLGVIELQDGRIARWRDYFDTAAA